jgi:hypothetical protein
MQRLQDEITKIESEQRPLRQREDWSPGESRWYKNAAKRKQKKTLRLARLRAKPLPAKGARPDSGAEHLCKLLTLLVYNLLALLLWRSPIEEVRTLTPAMVGQLLLFQQMTACVEAQKTTLWLFPLPEPTDRLRQKELVRLLNEARLTVRGTRLRLKLHDTPG